MRVKLIALTCLVATSKLFAQDELPGVGNIRMDVFADSNFQNLSYSGFEPSVDFVWGTGSPVNSAPADGFTVRLTGLIRAPRDGQYKVIFAADDHLRLTLNGTKVLDQFADRTNATAVVVKLTKKPQPFQIEYAEGIGNASLTMYWQPTGSSTPQVIPASAFVGENVSEVNLKQHGLPVTYFPVNFSRAVGRGIQYRTETNWDEFAAAGSPHADASARYIGFLVPPETGSYKFVAAADNRVQILVDGEPLIDHQYRKGNPPSTAVRSLTKDVPVSLRIDFQDAGSRGHWMLHWIPPGETTEVSIPPSLLFPSKRAINRR